MKTRLFLCAMLLAVTSVQVLVANQNYFTLKQPNGVTFQAREAGYCCYIHWYETPDGYMVIRGTDKFYHYAQPSQEQAFVASCGYRCANQCHQRSGKLSRGCGKDQG